MAPGDLRRCSARLRSEDGFTLVEILVVCVIVGILAAIAIPAFLGHNKKASDSGAKSDLRGLAGKVAECRWDAESYTDCDSSSELPGLPAVHFGNGPGQVHVSASNTNTFTAVAVSQARTNGQHHTFRWRHRANGTKRLTCTAGGAPNTSGGCSDGTW